MSDVPEETSATPVPQSEQTVYGSSEAGRSQGALAVVNPDVRRYERVCNGESITDIAASESISIEKCKESIKLGELAHRAVKVRHLHDLKFNREIENEEIRLDIRSLRHLAKQAAKILLEGKNTVVERNLQTGEIKLHEVIDPAVIKSGLEQFQKLTSLIEKPVPSTVIQLQQNNTQNNSNDSGDRGAAAPSFEERVSRLRQRQQAASEFAARVEDVVTEASEAVSGEIIDGEAAAAKGDPWSF